MTCSTNTFTLLIAALALAGTLIVSSLPASAGDRDPINQVRTWVSERSFNAMNADDLYDIDIAQRHGVDVIIEGHSPSQSREIVDAALAKIRDARAAHRLVL